MLSNFGDRILIDGFIVNGTVRTIGSITQFARYLQSGYLFHYAFAMILGLLLLIGGFVIYEG
jgi:NADH-quinone oxidoreductase subunit L